jgi:hypothetical protein
MRTASLEYTRLIKGTTVHIFLSIYLRTPALKPACTAIAINPPKRLRIDKDHKLLDLMEILQGTLRRHSPRVADTKPS